MSHGLNQAERLAALRAEVKKIEGLAEAGEGGFMPLGMADVDARIAGGGLAVQALHEVAAASPRGGGRCRRDPVPGGARGAQVAR
jgi:hypothetical protein